MSSLSQAKKDLEHVDSIIDKLGLKKTVLRRQILLAFMDSGKTLTQADLIDVLTKKLDAVDRVSIYRNLVQLKEAGVVHEVELNSYVFCSHECEDHAHILLLCQKCHKHQEVKDHDRIGSFMTALGDFRFFGKKNPIFLRGLCTKCTA